MEKAVIPTIPEIEKEFLSVLSNLPKNTKTVIIELHEQFKLKPEAKQCLTRCGRQKKFDNRVVYVRTKLLREKKIVKDSEKIISKL